MGILYRLYCKTYKLSVENHKEFFDIIGDIYYRDEIQSQKVYEQHRDINRLQHTLSVAYLSYEISKKMGINTKSATRAAMMHDLVYYDWHDGINGKWHKMHGYKHPRLAVLNAKELYPALTKLEENIIRRHMWPLTVIPPKYKESFVVTFADKYCATREFFFARNKKYKEKFLNDIEVL